MHRSAENRPARWISGRAFVDRQRDTGENLAAPRTNISARCSKTKQKPAGRADGFLNGCWPGRQIVVGPDAAGTAVTAPSFSRLVSVGFSYVFFMCGPAFESNARYLPRSCSTVNNK
ncbi:MULTISPECIES: hypothetical protein [unclassified Mesorhizobium]|uniref:hypothetical protein n=1 Tax=unclassified Mesorhizobium TaxID=325217 RepID=UPI001596F447|nr:MULTISPECIES: hypothetical protein [unclassified Mesorhizobium]